jgi:osmotically-inducible protein OsmY
MKYVYRLAFILVIGASFALAQTGAGSQSTPPTSPSQQQPGAQTPDNSQMGQTGASSADALTKAQSDIQSALRKQMPASADNVTVSVTDNNKIQLSGSVSSDSEKSQVEQVARSAAPNADIVNQLQVSSSPTSMPPSSTEPPAASKPPVLRLVAYQQSGSAGQGSSGSQDTQSPQNPTNPTTSSPGAGANGGVGQTADTSANGSDVQDKIQKAIQQDSSLANSNINVNVSNNKVELTGTVASKDQKKEAMQIAETNAGGMKVVDHLKVSATEATPSTPSTPPKN